MICFDMGLTWKTHAKCESHLTGFEGTLFKKNPSQSMGIEGRKCGDCPWDRNLQSQWCSLEEEMKIVEAYVQNTGKQTSYAALKSNRILRVFLLKSQRNSKKNNIKN